MPRTMLRIMFFGGLAWIAAELIKRFFGLNLVDVVFFGIAGLVVFSVFSVAEFFQKQARELQQLRGECQKP